MFEGRRLASIKYASLQPKLNPKTITARPFLEPFTYLISSSRDEKKLARLMHLVDNMITRCEATLQSTDHTVRCWWSSYTETRFHPIPFRSLLRPATQKQYSSQWKHFLCCVFRIWRLSLGEQEKVCGLYLRKREILRMEQIWQRLQCPRRSEIPLLTELVFDLSVVFLKSIYKHGQASDSALIHFLAVMGISGTGNTFSSAYLYTSSLAGLLWISRLLLLEYALPARSYPSLNLQSQDEYSNQIDRMNEVRTTYLLMGGFHPIAQMISILQYGRKIAEVEGTRCLVAWSEEGNRLECGNQFITMEKFQEYSHNILHDAEILMSRMMFGWNPVADLAAIKDDMRENTQGYSFVSNPDNGLERCYCQLLPRSSTGSEETALQKRGEWQDRACARYFEGEQKMLRYLLLLLHLTGGQPARGPELTTI